MAFAYSITSNHMGNTYFGCFRSLYINYVLLLIKLQCLVIQFSFKWRTNLNVAPQSDILNPTLNEKGDASGVSMASKHVVRPMCVEFVDQQWVISIISHLVNEKNIQHGQQGIDTLCVICVCLCRSMFVHMSIRMCVWVETLDPMWTHICLCVTRLVFGTD